jgi:hypothetical protein
VLRRILIIVDLSMTQSEDDLDVSGIRARRRKKRPSLDNFNVSTKKTRKSGTV